MDDAQSSHTAPPTVDPDSADDTLDDSFEGDPFAEDDDDDDGWMAKIAATPDIAIGLTADRLLSSDNLGVGSVINGTYELTEVLGKGGFAVVYKAKRLGTEDWVAIKVILKTRLLDQRSADNAIKRFKAERDMLQKLNHPNIVQLIDAGELDDGLNYLVLEYIEGVPLSTVIGRGPMPIHDVRHIMDQVLGALNSAHQLGVVHRDLKPANIMITEHHDQHYAKVLDFGVAGVIEDIFGSDFGTLTLTGQIVGTACYMAPEQLKEPELTPQSDLYAWGLIFVECLTGQRVIQSNNMARAVKVHLSPDPLEIPASWVGTGIGYVIAGALEKSTARRYPNAQRLLADLRNASNEHVPEPPPAIGREPHTPEPTHPQGTMIGIAVTLGVIVIALLVWLLG